MKASSSPPSLRTMLRKLNIVPKISFASSSLAFFCRGEGAMAAVEAGGGGAAVVGVPAVGCCDWGRDDGGLVKPPETVGGRASHSFEYMHSATVG